MVICCVPNCTSSSYNAKQRGVRFHEFPSNPEMRKKWIDSLMKCMSKTNWRLKDRTRICNLHFKNEDYKPCLKKCVLFPHAYPTVFPDDLYIHSVTLNNVSSNVNLSDPADTNCPIVEYVECTPEHDYKLRLTHSNKKQVRLKDVVHFDSEDGEVNVSERVANTSADASQATASEMLNNQNISNALKEENLSTKPAHANIIGRPPRSTEQLRLLLKKKDKKICRLNKKICHLTSKMKAFHNQIENTNGKAKRRLFELVEQVQEDAATGNNVPAQFLLDQILAYGKKLPKYSLTTLMNCATWRSKFRKGYTYVQKSGLMRLPERTTILKHMLPRKAKVKGDTLLEGLLPSQESESSNYEEALTFESAEGIASLSAKDSVISPELISVTSNQDLHAGLLSYEIRYPPMSEVFAPGGI